MVSMTSMSSMAAGFLGSANANIIAFGILALAIIAFFAFFRARVRAQPA